MTNKEILLSAIKLQKTPRVPVIKLAGGVWLFERHGLSLQDVLDMPPARYADLMLRYNEELGLDLIWTGAGLNHVLLSAIGVKVTFNKVGAASTVDEPVISSVEDLDRFKNRSPENDPGMENLLEATRILSEQVGNEVLIGVSQWGPFSMAGLLMGLEKFMVYTMRDRAGTEQIIEFTRKLAVKYLELFREAGAGLVNLSEPSASMISPKMFQELAMPCIKKANDAFKDKGVARMLHICGNTTKLLDLIPETGTDLFSFDYKVDLAEAKEKLGGKVAFAGNIDPVSVIFEGTEEDVTKAAENCIGIAGTTAGYVLMPGCDIPPKTRIENLKAMASAAHRTAATERRTK